MNGLHMGEWVPMIFVLATINSLSRYTRIETLSGFSNGIFLILISVFIVFEAVQRL